MIRRPDISTRISQNNNNMLNGNIPIHLLFPQPIPEPPRVVNSRPLIENISITSELQCPPMAKVKLKTSKNIEKKQSSTTKTSKNSEDTLQRLRIKYGIIPDHNGDNNLEEEEEEILENDKRKANEKHQGQLQKRLECIQQNIRKHLEKLEISNDSSTSNRSSASNSSASNSSASNSSASNSSTSNSSTSNHPSASNSSTSNSSTSNSSSTSNHSSASNHPSTSNHSPTSNSSTSNSSTSNSSTSNHPSASKQLSTTKQTNQCKCSSSSSSNKDTSNTSNSGTMVPISSSSVNGSIPHSTREMIEYIKRQDHKLDTISEQIEQLIRFQAKLVPIGTTSSTTSKDMSDRLTKINHHNIIETQTTTSSSSSSSSSPLVTSSTKYSSSSSSALTKPKILIEKRSIQTMTSFIAEKPLKTSTKSSKQSNYLDTSIEKIRQDLRTSLQRTNQEQQQNYHRKTKPYIVAKRINEDYLLDHPHHHQVEDHEQIYHNTLANVNSILVRNGSFETTTTTTSSHDDEDLRSIGALDTSSLDDDDSSSVASNGKRSSCSNTPSSELNFLQINDSYHENYHHRNNFQATSSPKQHSRIPQSPPKKGKFSEKNDNGHGARRYLLSEQSLYIERLASKYECRRKQGGAGGFRKSNDYFEADDGHGEEEEEDLILESVMKTTRTTRTSKPRNSRKLSKNDIGLGGPAGGGEDNDFERYALSDHNTSIATKNYLQKYGLTMVNSNSKPRIKQQQQKQHRTIDSPLIEVDENNLESNLEDNNNLPPSRCHQQYSKMQTGNAGTSTATTTIREIKSRPKVSGSGSSVPLPPISNNDRLNRILDLDAIKSLPKLI